MLSQCQEFSFFKTLNPHPPLPRTRTRTRTRFNATPDRDLRALAGRSKSNPTGPPRGRIEGTGEMRRAVKKKARQRARLVSESIFFRLKNGNKVHADNFTEDQLNMMGLGYDRLVQFMKKDDPNLKHPYDWYKYGEFGPYSWRGLVVGDPLPGKITDQCVTMYGEVKNHEEWEKIEQFEMGADFGERLKKMNKEVGFRYYWIFVRHPMWQLNDKPWEQWTLVSELVVEAGKQRVDKWSLMGRLGNKARKLITKCAAWLRPDIVYVKRPVYQCRFEPQEEFFLALVPYLDPKTERDVMFELRDDSSGAVEWCTYFEGLCKIVKVSQKAFVDDVVNAYEKMSDERKSRCLEFLLVNHPVPLLHPYTKEWKTKLEEMELGCDAPDEDDEGGYYDKEKNEFTEWIEDDEDEVVEDIEEEEDDGNDDDDGEVGNEEEDENYWEEKFRKDVEDDGGDEKQWEEKLRKAVKSADGMQSLVTRSVERSSAMYKRQLESEEMEETEEKVEGGEDGDETALRGVRARVHSDEWKIVGIGKWNKRIRKSRVPPELFLPAAIRPFTYRNLVKEIVLMRHAILEGEVVQGQ